jgi:hypothetical protein
MTRRIGSKFEELKSCGKKAFIPFIMAGDPDLETTIRVVLELERSGSFHFPIPSRMALLFSAPLCAHCAIITVFPIICRRFKPSDRRAMCRFFCSAISIRFFSMAWNRWRGMPVLREWMASSLRISLRRRVRSIAPVWKRMEWIAFFLPLQPAAQSVFPGLRPVPEVLSTWYRVPALPAHSRNFPTACFQPWNVSAGILSFRLP